MEERAGSPCASCGAPLCGHSLAASLALGYADNPRCLTCVARALGHDPGGFAEHAAAFVGHKDCFRAGWAWADGREACGHPAAREGARGPMSEASGAAHDAEWDAGDLGCGDLVLELRKRLLAMRPGQVLLLRALDPGAPEDLPAWCGMTGHAMLRAEHPRYWIRRKED